MIATASFENHALAAACHAPPELPCRAEGPDLDASLRNGIRFGFDFSGGYWSGASAFAISNDMGMASKASPPPTAKTLWRWSDAADLSYAGGELVIPIFGGFLGQAGGGTTSDGTLFGLYGGLLLPGIGTRTALSESFTLEATVRGVYSRYSLEVMGGSPTGHLSAGGLSARADVRVCSNRKAGFGLDYCIFTSPSLYESGVLDGGNLGLAMVL
ncbi:MAG: hypothetical protein ACXWP4_05890 [Polyangiales bacterium]